MKYIYFLIVVLLIIPVNVWADSYVLNLFNDNGQLRFDKFIDKIKLDTEVNTIENLQNQVPEPETEYSIRLISSNQAIPPIDLPLELQPNDFSHLVPYYSHIQEIQLIRSSEVIDTVDVSQFATCNSDAICQYENGESLSTCLADCSGTQITYSEQTQRTLQEQNGVIRDEQGTVLLQSITNETTTPSIASADGSQGPSWVLLVGGLGLIGLGLGVFIYSRLKR